LPIPLNPPSPIDRKKENDPQNHEQSLLCSHVCKLHLIK
jgi:hypothetical protein